MAIYYINMYKFTGGFNLENKTYSNSSAHFNSIYMYCYIMQRQN